LRCEKSLRSVFLALRNGDAEPPGCITECLCNSYELKEIPEFLPEESEAARIVYAKEDLTRLNAEKSVGIIGL